jgi:hypothetical protein
MKDISCFIFIPTHISIWMEIVIAHFSFNRLKNKLADNNIVSAASDNIVIIYKARQII